MWEFFRREWKSRVNAPQRHRHWRKGIWDCEIAGFSIPNFNVFPFSFIGWILKLLNAIICVSRTEKSFIFVFFMVFLFLHKQLFILFPLNWLLKISDFLRPQETERKTSKNEIVWTFSYFTRSDWGWNLLLAQDNFTRTKSMIIKGHIFQVINH